MLNPFVLRMPLGMHFGIKPWMRRWLHYMLGVMELELSLRGSVEMSSSTSADIHDVPQ
jgi:hypothetical protein